jgi:ABC-type transport system substrate-binding protein
MISFFVCQPQGFSATHRRPIPILMSETEPYKVKDIYSMSLHAQIHATLFRYDADNQPVTQLVESFHVSKDKKSYFFKLKNLQYHDGSPLEADDVKWTFERAIKSHSIGYDSFNVILGAPEFLRGQRRFISGIRVIDKTTVCFDLSKPFPKLIYSMTNIRFSIVKPHKPATNGLGEYKIINHTEKQIELSYQDMTIKTADFPVKIIYEKVSEQEAIKGFIEGKYDDLFMYNIDLQKQPELEKVGIARRVHIPRTYLIFFNAKKVTKDERNVVFNRIDRQKIVDNCYPGNVVAPGIIPPGFLGYIDNSSDIAPLKRTTKISAKSATSDGLALKSLKKLTVAIDQTIGSANCVKQRLLIDLKGIDELEIIIENTDRILKLLKQNKIDMAVAYFDALGELNSFDFFNPNLNFTFGEPGDKKIVQFINELKSIEDPILLQKTAIAAANHILEIRTALPIFHPKTLIVYSKKYLLNEWNVDSSSFISFTNFRIKGLNLNDTSMSSP